MSSKAFCLKNTMFAIVINEKIQLQRKGILSDDLKIF